MSLCDAPSRVRAGVAPGWSLVDSRVCSGSRRDDCLLDNVRGGAKAVVLVLAMREPSDERRLYEGVCDRIIEETHGNPLALPELPRGMSAAELAGGFAVPALPGLSAGIEEGFRRRLDALPPDTPCAPVGRAVGVGGLGERRAAAGPDESVAHSHRRSPAGSAPPSLDGRAPETRCRSSAPAAPAACCTPVSGSGRPSASRSPAASSTTSSRDRAATTPRRSGTASSASPRSSPPRSRSCW